MKRESLVFFLFPFLSFGLMSMLWSFDGWAQFWMDLGLLKQWLFLCLSNGCFGFSLIYAAKQTRSGYVVIAPLIASFFMTPFHLWQGSLVFMAPVSYLIFSFAGSTNMAAIFGGFLARRILLKRLLVPPKVP